MLAQIRQTALRKLDKEQVEQERAAAASDKEGMLFHSLQESVKMALEIRKKAMEAHVRVVWDVWCVLSVLSA